MVSCHDGIRWRRLGGLRRWPEVVVALFIGTVVGVYLHRWHSPPPAASCGNQCCASVAAAAAAAAAGSSVLADPVSSGGAAAIRRRLVLVGVLTAQKFIDSRAAAVYNTWAKSIPGDVIFFSSEGTRSSAKLRVVPLPWVDDAYPPQKKSFMMLKYMHDHYAQQYDWFMRVDDDVYVKGDRLATFLHSINSSKPLFIGQSGQGSKDELGQLSLNRDENFCMGGPGMILSAPALQKVAPRVSDCLQSLYTTHEDVEVGRCVRRFAGIQCTWSFEMPRLFYHNYGYKEESVASFPVVLPDRHVEPAITLHPVKTPENMHRVHNDVLSRRCRLLRHRTVLLSREMELASHYVSNSEWSADVAAVATVKRHNKGTTLSDPRMPEKIMRSQPWEAFTSRELYTTAPGGPRRGLPKPLQALIKSTQWQAVEILGKYAEHNGGGSVQLTELHRGFWQSPALGDTDVRVMLDAQLTYQRPSGRHSARRQLLVRISLGDPEVRLATNPPQGDDQGAEESPSPARLYTWGSYVREKLSGLAASVMSGLLPVAVDEASAAEKPDLVMILPLSGRTVQLARFLQNYERVCLRGAATGMLRTRLIIVAFMSPEDGQLKSLQLHVDRLRQVYIGGKLDILLTNGTFSRGRALHLGAANCTAHDLLLFIDVDMEFDADALRRAAAGAWKGVRAYFPIVFSQYDSSVVCGQTKCSSHDRDDAAGFFRFYGYGIASIYRQDLDASGGFNLSIHGWGKEDVDVFEGVLRSGLEIFRAADHGLVHIYHPMACSSELSPAQLLMCRGSFTSQLASVRTLYAMLTESSAAIVAGPTNLFSPL